MYPYILNVRNGCFYMPQSSTLGDKVVRKTCMLLSCAEDTPLKGEVFSLVSKYSLISVYQCLEFVLQNYVNLHL